jgi:hypothetical protein
MNRKITFALLVLTIASGLSLFLFLNQQSSRSQPTPKPQYSQGLKPKNIFTAKTRRIFDKSEDVTIYTVTGWEKPPGVKNTFRGYEILGTTRLTPALAGELRAAFYANSVRGALPAQCFSPHHGIRARHQGKTVDIVICFSCGLIRSYDGEILNQDLNQNPFSSEGRDAFDDIFRRAGLEVNSERR